MTNIKLTKDLGGNKAGTTITVSGDDAAQRLIDRGLAEQVKATPKAKAKPKPDAEEKNSEKESDDA